MARVAGVLPLHKESETAHAACARTWTYRVVQLLPTDAPLPASEAGVPQGCSGGSGSGSEQRVDFVLYDDAVWTAELLAPGETVAIYQPLLRCVQQGSNVPAVQLTDASILAVVPQPEPAPNINSGQPHEASAAKDAATVVKKNLETRGPMRYEQLHPGMQGVVLQGVVAGEPSCSAHGRSKTLRFQLCQQGLRIPVEMHIGPGHQRALQQVCAGQSLLLGGVAIRGLAAALARADGASTSQPASSNWSGGVRRADGMAVDLLATWSDAGAEAVCVNLSCLPGLLCSPALQHTASLHDCVPSSSADQRESGARDDKRGPSAPTSGDPCVWRGVTIKDIRVATNRVHKACGRGVSRVSLGLGLMFEDEGGSDSGASTQEKPPSDASDDGCLWQCSFCGIECAGADVSTSYRGSASFCSSSGGAAAAANSSEGGTGAAAHVTAELDDGAIASLLGLAADAYKQLPSAAQAASVASVQGRHVTCSAYFGGGNRGPCIAAASYHA